LAVLEAEPVNVDALHYLGVLRHQQGRTALGIDLVLRAITLRPDYFDALNNIGNMYLRFGPAEAVTAYNKALRLRPSDPGVLRHLERHEEAAELFQRGIRERPDDMENYYSLAVAYKEMGRSDDAVATLRKAIEVKPESEGFR